MNVISLLKYSRFFITPTFYNFTCYYSNGTQILEHAFKSTLVILRNSRLNISSVLYTIRRFYWYVYIKLTLICLSKLPAPGYIKVRIALKPCSTLQLAKTCTSTIFSIKTFLLSMNNDVLMLWSKWMHSITVGTWALATTTAYRQYMWSSHRRRGSSQWSYGNGRKFYNIHHLLQLLYSRIKRNMK